MTTFPGGATTPAGDTPVLVTGLTDGTSYTFTITATNGVGTSAPSAASSPVTPAGAPTAPDARPGQRSRGRRAGRRVSWTAPAANGSPITGYTVTTSPGGATAPATGSPLLVTGLTDGTSYTFTVTATNSVGTSAQSVASTPVIPTSSATAPDAPTGVSAVAGDGKATVSWTTPAANGSPITGYTVTTSPGGATTPASGSPLLVTGLTDGTSYTFTVTATNSVARVRSRSRRRR